MPPEIKNNDQVFTMLLETLRDIKETQKDIWEEIGDIKSVEISSLKADIAVLKTKAGIWGMVGGAIPVGIGLLVYFLEKA